MDNEEFYLGKRGALYLRRQNGSLSRFGIRVRSDGTIKVFDHLTRKWHALPEVIPDRSGEPIRFRVERVTE
ncbi:MAG: hypothetical protein GWN58_13675 [Anaerolineae bacterium]|nr:hypothetical protein [Anaerolineae bacterium]